MMLFLSLLFGCPSDPYEQTEKYMQSFSFSSEEDARAKLTELENSDSPFYHKIDVIQKSTDTSYVVKPLINCKREDESVISGGNVAFSTSGSAQREAEECVNLQKNDGYTHSSYTQSTRSWPDCYGRRTVEKIFTIKRGEASNG